MSKPKANGPKPTTYIQTHVGFVIDRSGSMSDCWGEMVTAVNCWFADARKDENLKESDVELAVFDSQSIDVLRTGAPLNIKDLTPAESPPRAATPLYDAVGRGIDSLDRRLAASGSHKAVLIIVTDGAENSSQKYSHGQLQELIKARQAAGWTVIFMGAGLEAAQQYRSLGIHANNAALIGKSAANLSAVTRSMYAMASGAAATMDCAEAQSYSASEKLSTANRQAMGDATNDLLKSTSGDKLNKAVLTASNTQVQSAAKSDTVKDIYENVAKDAWGH